jgi:pilus assembly protein CpaB
LKPTVVAARALPVGIVVQEADLKLARLPAGQTPPDGFSKLADVVDRAVVSGILPDEPMREARLAARGAGVGLAPVIPAGMRAVAVRVNDVVGVAGFVLPGMRVDVILTGRPPGTETTVSRTVLQDILVLAAGQTMEPDARGKAINATVVTLQVSPVQAEVLALAGEGRVQLVLRNTGDRELAKTGGSDLRALYGRPEAPPKPVVIVRRAPPPPVPVASPPPAPPATEEVVVYRGAQRSVEQAPVRRPHS